MQIHELNSFSGSLDSGAYVAVDNGTDTGKTPVTAITSELGTRVDNLINNIGPSEVTTLWTGTMASSGDSATLSDDVSNYDYIDVYVSDTDYQFIRRNTSFINSPILIQAQKVTNSAALNLYRTRLAISGTSASITEVINWHIDGGSSYSKPDIYTSNPGPSITRIDGVKVYDSSSIPEIADARIGADGTTYPTLGGAIRGQAAVLSDLIHNVSTIDTPIENRTNWVNKRVTETGLVNSPSQLTSETILYIGKGNILKIEAESNIRNLSISYYSYDGSSYSYIQSDISRLQYISYTNAKYDYLRISFVGTSANPPVLSEFNCEILRSSNFEFVNKKLAILGDSISTYSGISESDSNYNAPYYPTSNVQSFEQTYSGMFYYASGASDIAISAISNSSWRNQNNASCPSAYETTRITRLALNGAPDYVFINMGTNDPYSSNIGTAIDYTYDISTLESQVAYSSYAIQTTIRKIQSTYPDAKIVVLIPKFPSAIGSGNYTFEKWERLCDFMFEISDMYGIYKIVDLRKCGITIETFSTDCISGAMHPNFNGMKKMGKYMIDELLIK